MNELSWVVQGSHGQRLSDVELNLSPLITYWMVELASCTVFALPSPHVILAFLLARPLRVHILILPMGGKFCITTTTTSSGGSSSSRLSNGGCEVISSSWSERRIQVRGHRILWWINSCCCCCCSICIVTWGQYLLSFLEHHPRERSLQQDMYIYHHHLIHLTHHL